MSDFIFSHFIEKLQFRTPSQEEMELIQDSCFGCFTSRQHSIYVRMFLIFMTFVSIILLIASLAIIFFYDETKGRMLYVIDFLLIIANVLEILEYTQPEREKENFQNNEFAVTEVIVSNISSVRECESCDGFVFVNAIFSKDDYMVKRTDVLMTEKLKTILEFQNVDEYPCLLIKVKNKPELIAITKT